MLKLLIAVALTLGSVSRGAAQWDGTPSDTAPRFASTLDAVAELVGLPRLREAEAIEPDEREVRLWVGFGLGVPHRLLRVIDKGAYADGDLIYWWNGEEPRGTFHGTPEADREWRAGVRSVAESVRARMHNTGCTLLHQTRWMEACEFVFEEAPNWARLVSTLDEIDPWTLPDPRTLDPPPGIGLDGITVVVEIRTSQGYRTYSYWTPQRQLERPEYARAYALMRLMPG